METKMIFLNKEAHAALLATAEKNYRTPELQILYWLSKEGTHVEVSKTEASIFPKSSDKKWQSKLKKQAIWTPEKRAEQAERIRQYWANGRMKRKSNGLDRAAAGKYDD